jgi:hypothetical protein
MSKLEELIAATQQLAEKPNNDCASLLTTGMICKTIIAAVGLIAAALLLWYLIKRVADGIKRYADSRRKRKDAEIERNYYEKHKAERELMTEKERLFVLKKEYQIKALNYIEEQAKNHIVKQIKDLNGESKYEESRPSCDKDTYLTQVDAYINAINDRIKELNTNT